ncbi:S-layer homology domain-containing protein [Candidatus Gracilibacteria bacterium]|nr:S-layer homology domain-containing protein [Candidatus Gracilibacteria bacterium]
MKNKLFKTLLVVAGIGLGAKLLLEKKELCSQVIPFTKKKVKVLQNKLDFRKRKVRTNFYSWKRFLKEKPASLVILALMVTSILGADFINQYSHLFRASLIGLKPTIFTGTVMPIEKVPNWVTLSEEERQMAYDLLPEHKLVPLPEYDPNLFKEGQVWQPNNEHARNTYITYPVPNLGNYDLDGSEHSGSHTGIDIKVPVGTPVLAIANGIVYKTANLRTGFGKHITVAHVDIPDPENEGKKTTLFSSYAHLSDILVKEGQEVKKGEMIGKSGNSGMTTAYHLHFQIDRADAPFYPYWPFTWPEVRSAGLDSYFEAVRHGLGQDKAEKYTVHPSNFVAHFANYINPNQLVASSLENVIADVEPEEDVKKEDSKTILIPVEAIKSVIQEIPTSTFSTEDPTVNTVKTPNIAWKKDDLVFETDNIFIPGEDKLVEVRVNEEKLVALAGIEISSTLRHLADISPRKLTRENFSEGVAKVKVNTDSNLSFKLIAYGDFGEVKSSSLKAQVFKDVASGDSHAQAIKYLKEQGVISGYPDGTFRPEGTLNRAEALKIILIANNIPLEKLPTQFPDVPKEAWFLDYVTTAVKRGIVKGYDDSVFRPDRSISRAEFLKISILTAELTIKEDILSNPYPDVQKDSWYAPYFDLAKKASLLSTESGGYIRPAEPITRGEAATVIEKLATLRQK